MQKSFKEDKPTLYIVSTPIGNLGDMTYRAIEILKSVDIILAEDTRTSGVLLSHYDIKTPMMSYHMHNASGRMPQMIEYLEQGKNLALISDAGTPGISDPGDEIIQRVIDAGFHVVAIPGASALLAALLSSGLSLKSFTFIGFLPRKVGELKNTLEDLKASKETLIFYESPQRIKKTIDYLYEIFGNREVALCRELTKTFESILRTDLKQAQAIEHDTRGEYVIVVSGNTDLHPYESMEVVALVNHFINMGFEEKDALKQAAKAKKTTKSEIYKAYKIFQQKT
jgi:16S rRNA (cytidine1402-2'-O)-methyltransferase